MYGSAPPPPPGTVIYARTVAASRIINYREPIDADSNASIFSECDRTIFKIPEDKKGFGVHTKLDNFKRIECFGKTTLTFLSFVKPELKYC